MPTAALAFDEGDYISDGERLLWVIEWNGEDEAIVENCATNTTERLALNPRSWRRIEPGGEDE